MLTTHLCMHCKALGLVIQYYAQQSIHLVIWLVPASLGLARQGQKLCVWVLSLIRILDKRRAWLPGSVQVMASRLTSALSIGINGILCMVQAQLDPALKL